MRRGAPGKQGPDPTGFLPSCPASSHALRIYPTGVCAHHVPGTGASSSESLLTGGSQLAGRGDGLLTRTLQAKSLETEKAGQGVLI